VIRQSARYLATPVKGESYAPRGKSRGVVGGYVRLFCGGASRFVLTALRIGSELGVVFSYQHRSDGFWKQQHLADAISRQVDAIDERSQNSCESHALHDQSAFLECMSSIHWLTGSGDSLLPAEQD
jgi:hypothetical protein